MAFEPLHLLWLLLPFAAATGWLAARRDHARKGSEARQWPNQYFRGVNYLLNEQPDKAIELFTRMVEVNTETVETHLALGSLFRRRGEVERAIRIHQNLMARPALAPEYRTLSLYELAQDYFKAGLLDRAEGLFLELSESREYAEAAMRALLQIYEQEKEWGKAITIAQRLAHYSGDLCRVLLAQYHCEQAEQSVRAGHPVEAERNLTQALQMDARCVRARLLSGRLLMARGEWRDAIREWQSIEGQHPEYLEEVVEEMAEVYQRLGEDAELERYLTGLMQRHPGERILLALADTLVRRGALHAARQLVKEHLQRHPSAAGLHWLVCHPQQADAPRSLQEELVANVLERMSEVRHVYQCDRCGYRGTTLHWQCPACHEWVTTRPVQGRLTSPSPVSGHRTANAAFGPGLRS